MKKAYSLLVVGMISGLIAAGCATKPAEEAPVVETPEVVVEEVVETPEATEEVEATEVEATEEVEAPAEEEATDEVTE